MNEDFFDQCTEHSQIKARIVSEYFEVWANIILSTTRRSQDSNIAYIDLFSGPGRYNDGTESTPLMVLRKAIENKKIRDNLVSIFTDKDQQHVKSLQQEISNFSGVKALMNIPEVKKEEVGENIVKILKEMRLIPSLVFLDPCGYKGLSLELINSVIKDWACECIFFFNYNRINAGIHNDSVDEHINQIFGQARADKLRRILRGQRPNKREISILNELLAALKESHGKFVRHFCFKQKNRNRTSHYLIFVTKKFKGYEKMSEIMAKHSSSHVQGAPSYEYNPFYIEDLFYKPLDELKEMLLNEFAGQTLKMHYIYEQHSVGKDYIKKNYKEALNQLAEEGKITIGKPREKRLRKEKLTLGDDVIIKFPNR